jgi:DNA polymerase
VKHFKWKPAPKGKRRIHEKPNATEIAACRFWLETELQLLKPRLIVALGATAAQALFGKTFKVTQQRGQPIDTPLAAHGIATVHPSSILRAPDEASSREEYRAFVKDLRAVAKLIAAH